MGHRDFPYSLEGIETDIGKRWEQGRAHHPESAKLGVAIDILDFKYNNDSMGWNFGGDGDNGEGLLYLLDIYFEAKDRHDKELNNFLLDFSNSCMTPQHE